MPTRYFYGQIVRIRVARHGKEKRRPIVVVTPNDSTAEGAPLVGVAITGMPDPPAGFEVPLPWQAQGRSRTGLDKPDAAVCRWFVTFTAADVIDALGHVPPEPMRRIEEAIRRQRGDPSHESGPPSPRMRWPALSVDCRAYQRILEPFPIRAVLRNRRSSWVRSGPLCPGTRGGRREAETPLATPGRITGHPSFRQRRSGGTGAR
jgi:mRNA-degrading endonuclease toxin of MazEF toxin-antitoxin module